MTFPEASRSLVNAVVGTLFGHGPMSDLSPLSGGERKLDFGAVRSVDDRPITDNLRCLRSFRGFTSREVC